MVTLKKEVRKEEELFRLKLIAFSDIKRVFEPYEKKHWDFNRMIPFPKSISKSINRIIDLIKVGYYVGTHVEGEILITEERMKAVKENKLLYRLEEYLKENTSDILRVLRAELNHCMEVKKKIDKFKNITKKKDADPEISAISDIFQTLERTWFGQEARLYSIEREVVERLIAA